MIAVIQRASQASVTINREQNEEIGGGLVVLLGIEDADGDEDISWLTRKIVNLRIFDDEKGVMNRSLTEVGGEILLISQFTLHASTKKGNRPSYIRAAKPETAIPLYEAFIARLRKLTAGEVKTGKFGAYMEVALTNDGPVTIIIDTKNKQ